MSDDPSLNDETELLIRAYLGRAYRSEEGDSPLETVSFSVSMMEMLILTLGLNRLVNDDYVPILVKRKCAVLVERLTNEIEKQKLEGET